MNETPLKQVIDASLENLKKVISTENVVGEPIRIDDGTVIVPIAKVSVGFTSGGVDYDSKKTARQHFGGGNGAGISMTPTAFLVISNGDVRLLSLNDPKSNNDVSNIIGSVSDLIDRAPSIVSRIKAGLKKDDQSSENSEAESKKAFGTDDDSQIV